MKRVYYVSITHLEKRVTIAIFVGGAVPSSATHKDAGLMGFLQPGIFNVSHAQASAKLRCLSDIREPGAIRAGQ